MMKSSQRFRKAINSGFHVLEKRYQEYVAKVVKPFYKTTLPVLIGNPCR